MAGVKDMDLDPGYTYLLTHMWKNNLTEMDFSEAEITAAFDAITGQSLLIIPTANGYKIMIGSREMAEKMAEGLDVETGGVNPGVTLN